MINIKMVSQAASLEETRMTMKRLRQIHVIFNRICVYRENYATVKTPMGRIFVCVHQPIAR
jgi:hypothetical protein